MPDFWTLETTAKQIPASPEEPTKITNGGASTVGRNTTSAVISTDNSLTAGQSYIAEAPFWYVSAASSHLVIEPFGAAEKAGSFRTPDIYTYSGPPISGTTLGAPRGAVDNGGLLLDTVNGNLYVNENTSASPYWTPAGYDQAGLYSAYVNNSVGAGVTIASSLTEDYVGKGVRVFGLGLAETDDSGFVGGIGGLGFELNTGHVTNEVSKLTALGTQADVYKPSTMGTLVVDCTYTDVANITTSSVFIGFADSAAADMSPQLTGATTTATAVGTDYAGWYSDSSMTDANGGYLVSEKATTGVTQPSLTTSSDRPAAATYAQHRVEVTVAGQAIYFRDKAEVGVIPGAVSSGVYSAGVLNPALTPTTAVSPMFYVENATTTTRTFSVKQFSTWATIA